MTSEHDPAAVAPAGKDASEHELYNQRLARTLGNKNVVMVGQKITVSAAEVRAMAVELALRSHAEAGGVAGVEMGKEERAAALAKTSQAYTTATAAIAKTMSLWQALIVAGIIPDTWSTGLDSHIKLAVKLASVRSHADRAAGTEDETV
jgi:hypothetical protein